MSAMNDQNAKQDPPDKKSNFIAPDSVDVKPGRFDQSKEWAMSGAAIEIGAEIGAGQAPASTPADAPTTEKVAIGSKSVDATGDAGEKLPLELQFLEGHCSNCEEPYKIGRQFLDQPKTEVIVAELRRTIATLRAECAGLREDKARLDHIDAIGLPWRMYFGGASNLREAIDNHRTAIYAASRAETEESPAKCKSHSFCQKADDGTWFCPNCGEAAPEDYNGDGED